MTNQSNNSDKDNNQSNNSNNSGGSNNSNNSGGSNNSNNSGSSNNSNNSGGDTSNRGFASMDPEKQREIASEGGKAAHEKGTAHEFTSEEAREAGKQSHKNDDNRGS